MYQFKTFTIALWREVWKSYVYLRLVMGYKMQAFCWVACISNQKGKPLSPSGCFMIHFWAVLWFLGICREVGIPETGTAPAAGSHRLWGVNGCVLFLFREVVPWIVQTKGNQCLVWIALCPLKRPEGLPTPNFFKKGGPVCALLPLYVMAIIYYM